MILRASSRMLTLYDFRHKRVYEAENGRPGMGSQMYGRGGDDLIVDLPLGTLVYEIEPGAARPFAGKQGEMRPAGYGPDGIELGEDEPEEAEEPAFQKLLVDLSEPGQEFCVALGGRGGKGNEHFKSSTMRAPRFAQPGEEGEQRRIRLELKILADVGLVGLPNAGKSTFISAISRARPKIAPYPFTTLAPNLGVVEDDFGRQLVIADIPGLVEGAHQGLGLGHTFLRHVERTRILVHLLAAEETGGEQPFAGFDLIDEELAAFDPALAQKPQLRVINKIDLLTPEELEELRAAALAEGRDLRFISALRGDRIEELMEEVWRLAKPQPQPAQAPDADRENSPDEGSGPDDAS